MGLKCHISFKILHSAKLSKLADFTKIKFPNQWDWTLFLSKPVTWLLLGTILIIPNDILQLFDLHIKLNNYKKKSILPILAKCPIWHFVTVWTCS